jgi:hypothetical protein
MAALPSFVGVVNSPIDGRKHSRKQTRGRKEKRKAAASIEIIPFISEDMRDPKFKESPYFSIPREEPKIASS